jgi:hypothetical protein
LGNNINRDIWRPELINVSASEEVKLRNNNNAQLTGTSDSGPKPTDIYFSSDARSHG